MLSPYVSKIIPTYDHSISLAYYSQSVGYHVCRLICHLSDCSCPNCSCPASQTAPCCLAHSFSVKHTAITVCPCACPAKGRGHPMIGPLCIKCPCYCGPSVGSHKPRIRVDTEVPPASPQGSVPWVLLQGGSPGGILGFDPPTSGTEVKSSNH